MRPQDLLEYLKPATFKPFRISMTSGRNFHVGHPGMVRVTPTTALVFDVGSEGIVNRYDTISLLLIEQVSHLEPELKPGNTQGNGQGA